MSILIGGVVGFLCGFFGGYGVFRYTFHKDKKKEWETFQKNTTEKQQQITEDLKKLAAEYDKYLQYYRQAEDEKSKKTFLKLQESVEDYEKYVKNHEEVDVKPNNTKEYD